MEKGDWLRLRSHGLTFLGRLLDENNNFYAIEPLALVLPKNEIDHMEELPSTTATSNALKTVSVGRQSYLGKTAPFKVESLKLAEED